MNFESANFSAALRGELSFVKLSDLRAAGARARQRSVYELTAVAVEELHLIVCGVRSRSSGERTAEEIIQLDFNVQMAYRDVKRCICRQEYDGNGKIRCSNFPLLPQKSAQQLFPAGLGAGAPLTSQSSVVCSFLQKRNANPIRKRVYNFFYTHVLHRKSSLEYKSDFLRQKYIKYS